MLKKGVKGKATGELQVEQCTENLRQEKYMAVTPDHLLEKLVYRLKMICLFSIL